VASPSDFIAERLAFYRAKAREAEEKAASAESPDVRKTWLDVAKAWKFLADQPPPGLEP
jgi:hypothetical protein